MAVSWRVPLEVEEARRLAMEAAVGVGGLVVTGFDHRTVSFVRHYRPTWALMVGVGAAPFTAFLSLLLLLVRAEEGFVVTLVPKDGQTEVRASGIVHDGAVERMTHRFATRAVSY